MAKSKNGGSRAYIRGRIGSDVYSVGKNGMGEKQQVVRSLAEQVSNPRTSGQMFGRMIMSTTMQAVSALTAIIDHSFDGVPKGQPSISQFIKTNYALIKADALAHSDSGNFFGLNKYQEKGVMMGKYIISDGNVVLPTAITTAYGGLQIEMPATGYTVGDLKAALGLSADGYLTYVAVNDDKSVEFFRVRLTTTLADSTVISGSNKDTLFDVEGNVTVATAVSTKYFTFSFTPGGTDASYGVIVSEKIEGAWKHNRCQLYNSDDVAWPSIIALPTYPTGQQMFLNGGDL